MFLETCLCVAVGVFAAVTDVGLSMPALMMLKVAQVVCGMVYLTTGTGEQGLLDVLQVITASSEFVAFCCCSACTDIRTNWFALTHRVLYVEQMLVTPMALTTRAGILEAQVNIHQVPA